MNNRILEPYEDQALELIAKGIKLLYEKKKAGRVETNLDSAQKRTKGRGRSTGRVTKEIS